MSTTGKYDDCRGTLVPGPNGSLFCRECGWRVEPGSPKYRTPKPTALEEKDAEITSLRAQLAEAKEALKFASETVAGLAATVADLRSELAEARAKAIEECATVADGCGADFLSPEYATGQPLSSFSERFACKRVAEEIRALASLKEGE